MRRSELLALTAALSPIAALVARAEVYLSEPQAVQALFPGGVFEKTKLTLSDSEVSVVQKASGQSPRGKDAIIFKNALKDCVIIDQALGKHELITFAVGITFEGKVKGIEILEYHESYGQQVREEGWRKQFIGKTKDSKLKVTEDIKNISGATLSSAHVTAGVKRVLQTYELLKNQI